jgi:protein-S-isoprenylcysteine O-methyltransferase Ste14
MITHIGFVLGFPSLQNALLYAATFAIQVVRLFREEAILMQDAQYQTYAARVRYRLMPGIF